MANSYTDANGVYRNKLGITDADQLKRTEYDMTRARSNEILEKRVNLGVQGFGLTRQQAIHRHIFQDVYEWAGKIRTTPLSKRMDNGMVSVFANPDAIEKNWKALEQKTNAFANAKGLTFEQKREALVDLFIEANRIHPFPEGNGRSLQVFMKELAHEQGIELDYSKTNSKEWNRASAISGNHGRLFEHHYMIPSLSDPEPIKKIFADMSSPTLQQPLTLQEKPAPRHDINKNQPQMHANATERMAENLKALKQNPALAGKPPETLERLAYQRGIAQECYKHYPQPFQDEKLAKFDKEAENPAFLEKLENSVPAREPERAEKAQSRGRDNDFEQSR